MASRKVFRKRGRKGRKVARKMRRTKRMPIKKLIKREIAKNVENKTFQYLDDVYDILPSNSPGFDANIVPVAPAAGGFLTISQGLGQGQRIGNRIKIKKLTVSGVIIANPYNATTNPTPAPVQVKVWFFYDKEEWNAVPTPQTAGDFLQFGNTSLGLQNQLYDHSMPINNDRYKVLTTRVFKVGYASFNGATGGVPLQGYFANNDFKLNCNFKVDLTKYAIKNVEFRDTATTPTTRGIFMMMQPVYANGSQIPSAIIPCRCVYMNSVVYEDA